MLLGLALRRTLLRGLHAQEIGIHRRFVTYMMGAQRARYLRQVLKDFELAGTDHANKKAFASGGAPLGVGGCSNWLRSSGVDPKDPAVVL